MPLRLCVDFIDLNPTEDFIPLGDLSPLVITLPALGSRATEPYGAFCRKNS